jgi:uncharacterized protein YyaL (SSP411 family)
MNELSKETSPYLLQHANNPVHWLPWGEKALARAKQENKPVLLSIGYSACHWCHVMAHESFEDTTTAQLMNELFINVKVDREERPDLDKIYQSAHSMLTNRSGGWPLTLFLTPDEQMPIFAGTYFPVQPRHGLPSFRQLLQRINEIHQTRQQDISKQIASMREAYTQMAEQDKHTAAELNSLPLDVARNQIEKQFDKQYGGFSGAPKFPHPAIIDRALRHWAMTLSNDQEDKNILHTAVFSLERMASGGLFDHLGGGFCRYSTDEKWMIPHFEKMLYDNAPLLWLNAQAWCITHDEQHLDATTETADWVIREMQSASGGYYSAQDADSEGVEGKYYVWNNQQIEQSLGQDSSAFCKRFGLDHPANFEGQWHLHACQNYKELAEEFNTTESSVRKKLLENRLKLFTERNKRIHPGIDKKILTSWNGLMIEGMAKAGRLLQCEDYIDSAMRAAIFIKKNMWLHGRLKATSKDGKSHLNAYLDDYAFLLIGLLELLQAKWDNELLTWAEDIGNVLIEQFEEKNIGGFFFTSHDHEKLIQRSKSYNDDATPSGNGIAASALLQLGYLTANTHYLEAAERCLKATWHSMSQSAISHCSLLNALGSYLKPPFVIILRGNDKDLQSWLALTKARYMPTTMIFTIASGIDITGSLADKKAIEGACAYVCEGTTCRSPITSINDFEDLINTLHFHSTGAI